MTFSFAPALVLFILLPWVAYIGLPRYRYRRLRDSISLALRLLMLSLLILALSGAQIVRAADKLAVVFLVDTSDSIDAQTQAAQIDYVREAIANMGINDRAGVVLFGANAVIERQVSPLRELSDLQAAPLTGNTDLAEAIRLGVAMFPVDAARRIVILSDGRATIGDTEAAAGLAAASNVQIDHVLFNPQRPPDVQVTSVDVPSTVTADQQFDLSVTIEAEANTRANVQVFASGDLIYEQVLDLRSGQNRYTLTLEAGESGFKDFRVVVDPLDGDGYYQNNQLSAFSRVLGAPRVLLMATAADEIVYLRDALEQSGFLVDVRAPNELPIGLTPLAQYESIVIANVAARFLSQQRMESIQRYVSDLGGGLVFIGGPESYAPGGYFQTPIEETLPLETRIRDQQRLPQLTIAYLIDTSGSMAAVGASGVQNIDLAKEAIIRSIEFLQPSDRAGVANFDTNGSWIANIQPVLDRRQLQALVATLRAGGGTDILAGMNLVASALLGDESERKHIILMTDGGADPRGLLEITEDIYTNADITTSVIAIGAGSAPFLADMANVGGGNYYLIDSIAQIPTIFTQETVLATRSYIIEETFFPVISAPSPIMNGISSSPQLSGYVATTPKQTSQVILRGGSYNDPLLATWQYGLGRVVAFTSDATARWSADWVTWDGYTRFWSQALQWTITERANDNIETQVQMDGESARVIVDARDENGAFLNGQDLSLSLIAPDLSTQRITLEQVAPGRYEAPFLPRSEGAYLLRLDGQGGQLSQTSGWVMGYSPEYDLRVRPSEARVLEAVSVLTGGRNLSATENPARAFEHTLRAQAATNAISAELLWLALMLLPFDIAVRRLVITRSDWARLWAWVRGGEAVAVATSERMSTLLSARNRARDQLRGEHNPDAPTPPTAPASPSAPPSSPIGFGALKPLQPTVDAPPKPPTPTPPTPPAAQNMAPPAEEGSSAARLLRQRRQQQAKDNDSSQT